MQQTFFDTLEVPRNQREARFLKFHHNNPKVYQLWDQFTNEAINRGYNKIGARLICERIRWETSIHTDEDIKFNDNYIAYYARLWMKNNTQHKNLFKTKTIEGE